jgi:hypothetical protein
VNFLFAVQLIFFQDCLLFSRNRKNYRYIVWRNMLKILIISLNKGMALNQITSLLIINRGCSNSYFIKTDP